MPWHPSAFARIGGAVLLALGALLAIVGTAAALGAWPPDLLRPQYPGWLALVGVALVVAGAWARRDRPRVLHIHPMWGLGSTASGQPMSLLTVVSRKAALPFDTVRAGGERAGVSPDEATAFACAWAAWQRLDQHGVPWPGTGHLIAVDVLARHTRPDGLRGEGVGRRAWSYAVLVVPSSEPILCATPERARHEVLDAPAGSVLYLAGYATGHEPFLAEHVPLVGLGLAPHDPFHPMAAGNAHHGGALEALDGGTLADVVAGLGQRGRQRLCEITDEDRRDVPEVDGCLLATGRVSDRGWPRLLAILYLYREIAGPRTDLRDRVHQVLRRWRARGESDGAWVNFWATWRHIAYEPVRGELWAGDWPDDLADAVPTEPVRR